MLAALPYLRAKENPCGALASLETWTICVLLVLFVIAAEFQYLLVVLLIVHAQPRRLLGMSVRFCRFGRQWQTNIMLLRGCLFVKDGELATLMVVVPLPSMPEVFLPPRVSLMTRLPQRSGRDTSMLVKLTILAPPRM